jgi:hypothetical protein
MALKADRYILMDDISFVMNEVAERGGMTVLSTGGSGAALDQSQAVVTYAASSSGKVPMGCLLNDVVNKDLTQTHLNFYKDEVQYGSKVALMTQGWILTNMIHPDVTPSAGDIAYVSVSGFYTDTSTGVEPMVGRFLSSEDEDGYAKVFVNLHGTIGQTT